MTIARCNLCIPRPVAHPSIEDDGVFRVPWDQAGAGIMAGHLYEVHGVETNNPGSLARREKGTA